MKYKVLLYLIMIVSYFMLLHTGCSKAEKSENSFYDEDKYCKVAKETILHDTVYTTICDTITAERITTIRTSADIYFSSLKTWYYESLKGDYYSSFLYNNSLVNREFIFYPFALELYMRKRYDYHYDYFYDCFYDYVTKAYCFTEIEGRTEKRPINEETKMLALYFLCKDKRQDEEGNTIYLTDEIINGNEGTIEHERDYLFELSELYRRNGCKNVKLSFVKN